jgi:hypothetical protein
LSPLDLQELIADAQRFENDLIAALRREMLVLRGRARVSAAALLLQMKDETGREAFLDALASRKADIRDVAIEFVYYAITPHDSAVDIQYRKRCPITCAEIFERLKEDLREPWAGRNERALEICLMFDLPGSREITRPVLKHKSSALRLKVASSYLRCGRDDGAFDVIADLHETAASYHSRHSAGHHEWHQAKMTWFDIEQCCERGSDTLKAKAAALAMRTLAKALAASDVGKRFDVNSGFVYGSVACHALSLVMPEGAEQVLESVIACIAIDEYTRGETLIAYAKATGEKSKRLVMSALADLDLRPYAAKAMGALVEGRNNPEDIAALASVLSGETRSEVVAALARRADQGRAGWPRRGQRCAGQCRPLDALRDPVAEPGGDRARAGRSACRCGRDGSDLGRGACRRSGQGF